MSRKRILVVDDDPSVGQAIVFALHSETWSIEVLTTAGEALRTFAPGKFDLILTDFRMEGMTGVQLAEQIKARDPAQPIILISASPPFSRTDAVDMVIVKPFSGMQLRAAVAKVFGEQTI